MLFETSWFKICLCIFFEFDSDRLSLALHHLLVLQVKLQVMKFIKRHFCGFTLPDVWNEVSNDAFKSFFSHLSFSCQFCLQCFLYLTKLHPAVVNALLKSCVWARIISVWIFPKFADERYSLTFVSPCFPVWNQETANHLPVQLFLKSFIT